MQTFNANKSVIMSPLRLLANTVKTELSSRLNRDVKSPVFVNTSEVYNILEAAKKKTAVTKKGKVGSPAAQTTTHTTGTPQTPQQVLTEVEEITIDSSDIGKGLASDAEFIADFAIPRKDYPQYLLRQVYLSIDRSTMDNVLLWGFADIDDTSNTKKFITSPTQSYTHLFFLHPANKQQPEAALPIKKGNSFIKERSSTLVFKALPPVVLKAEKLQVFDAQGFKGLLKHTLKTSTYKDLMNQYKPLVLAYDDWQRSSTVPLTAEGHAKISSHILDSEQFEQFLSDNSATYADAASLYEQASLKAKAKNTPSIFNIAKHDRSELMVELTQHLDSKSEQPSIAVSADGNSKTSVIFGDDIATKFYGFLGSIQDKHGFVVLENLDANLYFHVNSAGNSVVYTDACNEDGSVRVTTALVKRNKKDHLAMLSINHITDSKVQKQLQADYKKYKALVDAYNVANPEPAASTISTDELDETNGLPELDITVPVETVNTTTEELPDIEDPFAKPIDLEEEVKVDDILGEQVSVNKAPSSVKPKLGSVSLPVSRRRGTPGQRS